MRRAGLVGVLLLSACFDFDVPPLTKLAPMVTPAGPVELAPRDTLQLEADVDVDWTVDEPGGGTVTGAGLYTAPATGGTYHVVATALENSRETRVEISVRPWMKVLAGAIGGPEARGRRRAFTFRSMWLTTRPATASTWRTSRTGSSARSTSGPGP